MDHLRHFRQRFLKTSHFWLVFFVLAILVTHAFVFNAQKNHSPYGDANYWSYGGPIGVAINDQSGSLVGAVIAPSSDNFAFSGEINGRNSIFLISAAVVGTSHPFSNVISTRDGLMKYKVREGDTLSDIATQFGITLETVRLANPGVRSVISPGQELVVLSVSGILYEVEEGDTLEGVAARYKIDPELIKEHNADYQKLFASPKAVVILPYAEPLNRWAYINKYQKGLPNLNNYFMLPARGWNWGELHYYNAIDIAASCGEIIHTAAEGLVIEESSNNYWNDGYGNYILIEHPNGTKTRYAHTLKNFVARGDYILQGDEIAEIGRSGNTDGPTGCHLHFEVYGAQNPFAVR